MPDHPNTPGPWADGYILSDSESDEHSKRQTKDHPNTPGPWADGYILPSQHKDHSHTPGPWVDGYVLPTAELRPQTLPDIACLLYTSPSPRD